MPAKVRVVDFRDADLTPESDDRVRNAKGRLMTAKQVRARTRRKLEVGRKVDPEDFEAWSGKPIEDWDLEELARGRPRDAGGTFRGAPPKYMPRAVHEKIADRFKMLIKGQLNQSSVQAIGVVQSLLSSEEVDDKGKPIVPASTKLDAAKWLIEHVIGKAVQPTTTDVSVKLQAVLGAVMANPVIDENHPDRLALPRGYEAAHFGTRGGVIDVEAEWDDD